MKKKSDKYVVPERESKGDEWFRVKGEISPYFVANGLMNICELQYSMCSGNLFPLQFAHSKKRRLIAKEQPERDRELKEVIRVCTHCHNFIEYLPELNGVSGHDRMYKIVRDTIKRREKRLSRWKRVA